ncbi:DUF839 domain-containing protein [Sesbania bispinosa]|nr:DUF839 domain-containing protein [Sesbania bispinosa]
MESRTIQHNKLSDPACCQQRKQIQVIRRQMQVNTSEGRLIPKRRNHFVSKGKTTNINAKEESGTAVQRKGVSNGPQKAYFVSV